ncbi:MAG: sulfatase-like hydrolase/transferase [Bdellovibrionales bacterium]
MYGVGAIGLFVLEYFLIGLWTDRLHRKRVFQFFEKKWIVGMFAFVPTFIASMVYAYGDLYDIPQIKRVNHVVPLHQPNGAIKHGFEKAFGYLPTPKRQSMRGKGSSQLVYPKQTLNFENPPEKPFNIIYMVVDCLRREAFTPEIMPNIYKIAQERGQIFTNHHAGGNATRNGMFSLLYGLYSSYWNSFLTENRSPALFDRLIDSNYTFGIFSSEPLTFPEFRKTAFSRLNDFVHDEFPRENRATWERDLDVVKATADYLAAPKDQPFFSMIFLDSAHSGYSFPGDMTPFKPFLTSYNYSTLTDDQKKVDLKHSYQNAVYFLDHHLGKILNDMQARGQLENTIVVITGDHGQEFMEYGHTGHSGAFTRQQTMSPLILLWPDRPAKTYNHVTAHYDLTPTLMEYLGVTNPPSDYSMGHNLFDEDSHEYSFSCNWNQCAILDDQGWIIFGTRGNTALLEFRNNEYEIIRQADAMSPERTRHMTDALNEMGDFANKTRSLRSHGFRQCP